MPHPSLNNNYWEDRWQQAQTGWDIGHASPALIAYLDQYAHKDATILIPGCGHAHEAKHLSEAGFNHVTLLDIAPTVLATLKDKFKDLEGITIVCEDFFEHQGQYDLLLEQTFFCALPPTLREQYVAHVAHLLKPGGKLVGVLFNTTFDKEGPPFGGSEAEYRRLFDKHFIIHTLMPCHNSIAPRMGNELFAIFQKR